MATVGDILTEFRTALAAVATSRAPTLAFRLAPTNAAPDGSGFGPTAGAETFYVSPVTQRTRADFGRAGYKMDEVDVLVQLGHVPAGTELDREKHVARDVERVRDILETRAWTTSGVEAVFFESVGPTEKRGQWWVTALTFRVVYTGAVTA